HLGRETALRHGLGALHEQDHVVTGDGLADPVVDGLLAHESGPWVLVWLDARGPRWAVSPSRCGQGLREVNVLGRPWAGPGRGGRCPPAPAGHRRPSCAAAPWSCRRTPWR